MSKKWGCVSVVAFALFFIAGCKNDTTTSTTTTTSTSNPGYVVGGVFKEVYEGDTYTAAGVAEFGPMIPYVTINNNNLPFDLYSGGTYWDTLIQLTEGSNYNLKVDFLDCGKLTGSCKLPGSFTTTPGNDYTFPIGTAFDASWTASNGADWYLVSFDIYYDYYSQGSQYSDYYFNFDTTFVTTSRTFSIPATRLLSGQIDSINYGGGYFNVTAISGPIPQPGSYGNVTGNGYGFFLGCYFCEGVDIDIPGVGTKQMAKAKTLRSKEFFESLKKLLPGNKK
ncbi:MAG: hypothetical protein PHE49_11185 [bacterium]|nr:hypothetical protein [bacterium]